MSALTDSLARVGLALAAVILVATPAGAVHWYRGPGSGCTPADGALTDSAPNGSVAATVLMLHNTFTDAATGLPVVRVKVGDAVQWTWNSEHCHSVRENSFQFYSGFHFPAQEPTTPPVLPGLFHYPVPTLDPTLTFTHTFTAPGTFVYDCEHHALIGMQGVVIVE